MHWYVFVENQSYGPYSDEQMRDFVAEGRVSSNSLISNTPQSGFFSATQFDAYNYWASVAQQNMLMSAAVAGAGAVQATATNYAPIQPVKHQALEHQAQEQQEQQQPQQVQSYQIQQYEQPQAIQAQPVTQPVQPTIQPSGQSSIQPSVRQVGHSTGQPETYTPVVQPEARTPQLHNNKSSVFLIMAEIRSGGDMQFLQALQNFGQAQRVGGTVWLVRTPHSVEQIRNTLSQTLNQQDRLFILNSNAGKAAWFNIGSDLDHRIRELWDEDAG